MIKTPVQMKHLLDDLMTALKHANIHKVSIDVTMPNTNEDDQFDIHKIITELHSLPPNSSG